MTEHAENPAPRFPARLALRLGVVVVVVVIIGVIVIGSPDKRTVSQVIAEIRAIALAKPQGGLIGPWWVSSTGAEEPDGRLENFKVECGPIDIAAVSARVLVNHHTNTFQFEMWDVVFARMPVASDPNAEYTIQHLDRYVLGPLPYPKDIVPDENPPALPATVWVDRKGEEAQGRRGEGAQGAQEKTVGVGGLRRR